MNELSLLKKKLTYSKKDLLDIFTTLNGQQIKEICALNFNLARYWFVKKLIII